MKKNNPPNLTIVPKPIEELKNRDQKKAQKSIGNIDHTMPKGFFFGEGGLNYQDPQNEDALSIWICSKLEIIALTKDEDHLNFGKMMEFTDEAGTPKRWIMPKALLAGRSDALQKELLSRGLHINETTKAKNLLVKYVNRYKDLPILTTVNRVGWWGDHQAYVMPHKVFGLDDSVIYYSEQPNLSDYSQKGTLEEWQAKVAKYAVDNPRMMLFMCAAFAAPLLKLSHVEGGGFHIYGDSSTGKTTISLAAASVWGNAEKRKLRWRATDNGIEKPAFDHNDSLLWLDEIGEFEAKKLSKVIYMLSNGQAKQRATDIFLKRWKTIFISTGELSSKAVVQSVEDELKAGQEVRFINFPADTGNHGVFNTLYPEFSTAREQAEAIEKATQETCYGVAGEALINSILKHLDEYKSSLPTLMEDFIQSEVPKNAHPHIYRSAKRFAILAAAGELATYYNITGWEVQQAYNGIAAMFKEWLQQQGRPNISMEVKNAIRKVRAFIAEHGSARFASFRRENDDYAANTMLRAGWVGVKPGITKADLIGVEQQDQETYFYILPDVFNKEICRGMDSQFVLKALHQFDLVCRFPNGKDAKGNPKYTYRYKLPHVGGKGQHPITYAISAAILSFDI